MTRRSAQARVFLAFLALIAAVAGLRTPLPGTAAAAQVDVTFERAPVHDVLRVLAAAEGLNLIVDQDVTGEVTISALGLDALEAIRLVAGLRGLHLEQVGNTLIVSNQRTELGRMLGRNERSQLNFTRRPVSEVIEALAARAGWNLISEATIDREVTAWLEGIDHVEALRLVAASAGLRYQLTGGVLHIKGADFDSGNDQIAIFRLDHADVQRAKELLEVFVPGALVQADRATRSLVAKGSVEVLGEVASFLARFDVARPQVLVEARILEVAVDALEELGVEWSEMLTASGAGVPGAFELAWSPAQLQATLRSLAERGRSRVLASPKISALDQEAARMLIGDRVPIVTEQVDSEGRITQSVEFLDVGIVLEIEPRIASDGSAVLDIRTEVSSVVDPMSAFPTVRTREATTRVRVHDGRPLIIGGLIRETASEGIRGIPYLSELPVLGPLFGRRVEENNQTETVIILIPHIVTGAGESGGTTGPAMPGGQVPEAAISQATRVALESLEAPALSRLELARNRFTVSVDLMPLAFGATEVQFENERPRSSIISRMYAALGAADAAWSVGAAYRLYYGVEAEPPALRPWLDGGIEYASPLGEEPVMLYSAGAGFRLIMGEHGLLELYARRQEPSRPGALLGLPGRSGESLFGVKLGWRY